MNPVNSTDPVIDLPESSSPITPPPPINVKKFIPVLALGAVLAVTTAAVGIRQVFFSKASSEISVQVAPGIIDQSSSPQLNQPVYLSASAYDANGAMITQGVTYTWGISSSFSQSPELKTSNNLATFTPKSTGNGTLWVSANTSAGSAIKYVNACIGVPCAAPVPSTTPTSCTPVTITQLIPQSPCPPQSDSGSSGGGPSGAILFSSANYFCSDGYNNLLTPAACTSESALYQLAASLCAARPMRCNTPIPTSTPIASSTPLPSTTPLPARWVRISSPNGGEQFSVGQTVRISWTNSFNIDKVWLQYQSGSSGGNITTTPIPNVGYFDWVVNIGNKVLPRGVKIHLTGYQTGVGNTSDVSDADFTVVATTPTPTPTPTPTALPTPTPVPTTKPTASAQPTPPPGCYYQNVQCVQAPCNPILVCPTPTPAPTPFPRTTPTPRTQVQKLFIYLQSIFTKIKVNLFRR